MNIKFRALAFVAVGRKIETVLTQHAQPFAENGITPSCLSCSKFDENSETCLLVGERPPARIIAFGCERYEDSDDIPF